jgi:DNA-binding response OmpR family regulator
MPNLVERRLLIVEDDLDVLEGLQLWAEDLGWSVRTASSGHHALEIASDFKPSVLITDFLLEDDVTGVDVIVQLRKSSPSATCVLMTGVLQRALRSVLARLQGVMILPKPLNLDRLRQIVSTA